MERFTLDEGKAREWLAKPSADRADIEPGWNPRSYWDDSYAIPDLVQLASAADVIGVPGDGWFLIWERADDENEAGYRWEMWSPALKLAGSYEKGWLIGELDLTGIDAAIAILREGVDAANSLLADLDRYANPQPRDGQVLTDAEALDQIAGQLAMGDGWADDTTGWGDLLLIIAEAVTRTGRAA